MTPREMREAMAVDLRAAAPDGWTIYHAPPEQIVAPALVIGPRSPYRVDSTFCDEEVLLGLSLLVQRNASVPGLDELDDAIDWVAAAVHSGAVMAKVVEVTDIGPVQESGGLDYITAVVNVNVQLDRSA